MKGAQDETLLRERLGSVGCWGILISGAGILIPPLILAEPRPAVPVYPRPQNVLLELRIVPVPVIVFGATQTGLERHTSDAAVLKL